MALVAERVFVTEDEECDPATKLAQQVEIFLETLNMDTYNDTYVVKIVVDKVSSRVKQ